MYTRRLPRQRNGAAAVRLRTANDDRVRDATIALLQFERWGNRYRSLGIFEDQESINRRVLARFSDVCEKAVFPAWGTNRERITAYLRQILAGSHERRRHFERAQRGKEALQRPLARAMQKRRPHDADFFEDDRPFDRVLNFKAELALQAGSLSHSIPGS